MTEFDLLHLTLDDEHEEMILGNWIDGPYIWIVTTETVDMTGVKWGRESNQWAVEDGEGGFCEAGHEGEVSKV